MTRFTIFATLCVTTGTAFADTHAIRNGDRDFVDLEARPTTILDGAGAHTVVVVVDRETRANIGGTESIPEFS